MLVLMELGEVVSQPVSTQFQLKVIFAERLLCVSNLGCVYGGG